MQSRLFRVAKFARFRVLLMNTGAQGLQGLRAVRTFVIKSGKHAIKLVKSCTNLAFRKLAQRNVDSYGKQSENTAKGRSNVKFGAVCIKVHCAMSRVLIRAGQRAVQASERRSSRL